MEHQTTPLKKMFNFSSSSPSLASSMVNHGGNRMFSSVNGSNTTTNNNTGSAQQQQATVHTSYRCDGCSVEPIVGVRYHCATCGNFDYCENCFHTKKGISHPSFHTFLTHGVSASNNNSMMTSSKPISSSVIVNNPPSRNNNNMLTNNPMINSSTIPTTTSTTSNNMSNSMIYQPPRPYNPQQPIITSSYPSNMNNNIYQPPPSYPRSNPPPPSYPQQFPSVVGSSISSNPMTTSTVINQTPLTTSTTLNSAVKIIPPSSSNVAPSSSTATSTENKEKKECHCCSASVSTNIHQCVTCFELSPSEDYCLCKDCHENFKQFGTENPIHLHDHTFQHFVDVKHLNIWKKTKGLENLKKQTSDKFGELEKLEIEEDHLLCVICNEKLRNIVFLECKHCVCCHECVDQLKKVETKKECPLCRTVSEHIKIFWA
ncbi:predicted protein [Naegleria gruberi]|uniref:Predicted protein n=1 Tax=Naegleria gruberi TaxID=5762 RepID=D2V3H4_NAEGR|nr:uncharacterized protein NAEGRDRAFT_57004 [Naegleria gruberi]EFC48772.1 predicted protein [Naegleria gruberi]|eukprot:XP_002681516.1 predicted protein [Naegleria gruberi strain NEG-M]